MRYSRTSRISEEIKKIVSNIIRNQLKDPRVSTLTSVTHVETTNDLRYTNIYISVFDNNKSADATIDGLNNAKGYIRKELGKNLKLRYVPEPIFKADESIKRGIYMNNLIKEVNRNDSSDNDEEVNEDE